MFEKSFGQFKDSYSRSNSISDYMNERIGSQMATDDKAEVDKDVIKTMIFWNPLHPMAVAQ